jgi:diketogulonate reductase-like aldo/keto reductase
MEELYRKGRIKAIGVSNFHPDRVMDFMVHNAVVPVVDQIETHPFYQQVETQEFLKDNNIQIESWGPFAEGKNNIVFSAANIKIKLQRLGKTVAQVILRWLTQRDIVVIPKSVRKDRMAENFDIFNFELTQEDIEAIRQLDTGTSLFFDHRDPAMVKLLSEAKRNT